ncbi:T9SS type A sorting domain-containing protein [Flavobacterium sp. WC2509]|uniref:T9SS type A sorting domain-containing protein n=1 Tax=Flavobacterium sp. WC2509 TaxID=3461406 RepID=UPI0040440884
MIKKLEKKKALSILVIAFMASINLNAQTWTGATDTDFETATNWNNSVVPDAAAAVIIPVVAKYPIIAATTVSTISTLELKAGASLTINGSISPQGVTYTGGNIDINGGTLNARKNLNLGTTGSPATINVNSGTLNVRQNLIIGEKAPCVLNINGGEVSVDQNTTGKVIFIGGYYSSGIVNLNGGFLKTGPANVGIAALAIVESPKDAVNASGYLNINGGTLVFTTDQTSFVNDYVKANKIRTVAGKHIVATYDAGTNLTNVTAVANSLGTDSNTLKNTFAVYPNPSNGIINIDAKNNSSNLNLSVYNLLGQEIVTSALDRNISGIYSIDATNSLTPGTYIVNIKSDSGSYNSKIVVK